MACGVWTMLLGTIAFVAALQATAQVPPAGTAVPAGNVAVSAVLPRGCVNPGDSITLAGSGLSARQVQAVHLSGARERWAAHILSQSDTRLVLLMPSVPPDALGQPVRIVLVPAAGLQAYEPAHTLTVCTGQDAHSPTARPVPDRTADSGRPTRPESRLGERPPGADRGLPVAGAASGFVPATGAPGPQPQAHRTDHQPGEVVVFTRTLEQALGVERLAQAFGGRVASRIELGSLGYVLTTLRFPPDADLDRAMQRIREEIDSAIPALNHRYGFADFPQEAKTAPLAMIGWGAKSSSCRQAPRIGMLDSPLDKQNPALARAHVTARSFLPLGVPRAPADHGTAIASILVGSTEVHGLLPAAHLVAAEVFRESAGERFATAEDIVRALDWLLQARVHAVNLSFAGPDNALVELAIAKTLANGIPVVAAAGNEGSCTRPAFPAAYPGVLAVTAVDVNGRRYPKANCGAYVALAAPGVDIWAADGHGAARFFTGTSFAAPYVSAAAALLKQRYADRAIEELSETLFKTARDLGDPGRDAHFGWGLLQMPKRCDAALASDSVSPRS